MLPTYQNTLCAISNQEAPVTKTAERKTILIIFTINNDAKEININFNRFGNFIEGVERLRINNK